MKKINSHSNNGFTLIELLVVVVIMGILSAIAVPAYLGYTKKAYRAEATSNLQSLRLLEEQYYAENASYTPSKSGLADIHSVLKGFNPGADSQLKYDYAITQNFSTTGALNPCFKATATPRFEAASLSYNIDCLNNRTGGPYGTW
jgi:prepilin-type N-terminal cleavage/methylation domain-containing protein